MKHLPITLFIVALMTACTSYPPPLPVVPTKERVILDSELRTPVKLPARIDASKLSKRETLQLLVQNLELLAESISKHARLVKITCKAFNCEPETNVVNK